MTKRTTAADDHRADGVIVVGAGYAGVMAANRLARRCPVTVVNPTDHFVHRIRLHEWVAGRTPRVRLPLRRGLRPGVRLVLGTVDQVSSGLVTLTNGRSLRAAQILLTVGSGMPTPDGIGNLDDATAMRRRVRDLGPGARVTVLGGGATGIELACELAATRPDLAVGIYGRDGIGSWLPPQLATELDARVRRHRVTVHDHAPDSLGQLVIRCTGLSVPSLMRRCGLPVDDRGCVVVEPTLAVCGVPGLWAAGDAAHLTGQHPLRGSCAAAQPMGAHAADNILAVRDGAEPTPLDFGFSRQCLSLGRRDGYIVPVDPLDVPDGPAVHGPVAAAVKQLVCWAALLAPAFLAKVFCWRAAAPTGQDASERRPQSSR